MLVPFFFEFIQPHSRGKMLVKFEDVSPEEAEKLINKHLYLPLETLPELDGNDFYYHEIAGFKVIDTNQGEIGKIKSVNDSGAQALFEIKSADKIILIPVVDEWIKEVNRKENFIQIETPEGLIDLN